MELKKIFLKGSKLYSDKQITEAANTIMSETQRVMRVANQVDGQESWLNPREWYTVGTEKAKERACSFGLHEIDRALNPNFSSEKDASGNWSGSLTPGDTTLIVAPTNVGKTTVMMTIIAHNLKRNKKILWITYSSLATKQP